MKLRHYLPLMGFVEQSGFSSAETEIANENSKPIAYAFARRLD